MKWVVACFVVAGCGRLGFERDNPADAHVAIDSPQLTGHDEDGDNCPAHANPDQLDTDGDGVGDICDPEPANPRQSIALFNPFVDDDASYDRGPNWSHGTDVMHYENASGTQGFGTAAQIANSDFYVGLDLSTDTAQIAIIPGIDIQPTYYANLYQATINIVDNDTGNDFINLAGAPLAEFTHPGHLEMHFTSRVGFQQLDAAWPSEPYAVSASIPAYTGGASITVVVGDGTLDVRYFLIVQTN